MPSPPPLLPPQPSVAPPSVTPNIYPASAPQASIATARSSIKQGNVYRCPKCNALLTPGFKTCQTCGISFSFSVPDIQAPVATPASPLHAKGTLGFVGALAILLVIGLGLLLGVRGGGKGMSGIYTDDLGISTITFQRDDKYAFRGPQDFVGMYELQGNKLYLRPPQEEWDKLPADQKSNPLLRAMMNAISATVADDHNTFDLNGI